MVLGKSLGNCIVLLLILGFTIVFILWAHSSKIEKTVRAQGVVETNLTDKIVGHFEGGVVEKVFVAEGDTVRKGQEIVAIANTNITEKRNKSLIKMKRLQAKLNRLIAESNSNTEEFAQKSSTPEEKSEIQFARIRGDALREKINILKTQIQQSRAARSASEKHVQNLLDEQKVLKEQHDMLEPMVKKGIGSRQLLLQRKTELAKSPPALPKFITKEMNTPLKFANLNSASIRKSLISTATSAKKSTLSVPN